MGLLLQCVQSGFLQDYSNDPSVKPYWQYREALYQLDGVILYNDRGVVPSSMCQHVLQVLHSEHQGTSSMEVRARDIVFWLGYTSAITDSRNFCTDSTVATCSTTDPFNTIQVNCS